MPDRRAEASVGVRVEWYDGDRHSLRHLFEEAEDSAAQLDAYINDGRVLVARRGDDIVGHLQIVSAGQDCLEAKNMAVLNSARGSGIGRALMEAALAAAATDGANVVQVATAAADVGNLRFYQRCGFRLLSVERDVFTPETGYPAPTEINGIPLRDRVWLDRQV